MNFTFHRYLYTLEIVAAFNGIVSKYMAGLHQNKDVVWLVLSAPQIRRQLIVQEKVFY